MLKFSGILLFFLSMFFNPAIGEEIFTPQEKATGEVGGRDIHADGGFSPESEMPPSERTDRERSSLTGFTWVDCLREAKKNNPDLISADESINEQKAAKDITASSLYPQIKASLDASTTKTTTSAGVTTSSTKDSYSYGVSGSQLIFDGFKTVHDLNAAQKNIEAAQQRYRFASCEVRFALRTAFVNLLKAQELISVAEDIVKIRRDNRVLITLRYESGLEHEGALLTAEANLAEANSQFSQAKRGVEFNQRQLIKELGRKEFKPIYVKGDFIVHNTEKEKPVFEEIVKNNPSLLETIAKKNSAVFNVKSAYSSFSPKLSGSLGADKSGSLWPPRNEGYSTGLSLDMPLFEGGLKIAQLNQAKALYNQAQADERSIKDSAVVSLEQAWIDLQDAVETVDVQSKFLKAALKRSKIAEAQYSTGFINFDNWIIIENDLVRAKRAYLDAQINALLAEAGWIQAKGETLEYAQ